MVRYIISFAGGFVVAWFIGKIIASREFDRLLWQCEKDKQDLINQFNKAMEEKEE